MTDEHKGGIRGVGTVTDFRVKRFQALGGRNQTDVGQRGTRVITVSWGTGTLGIFVTVVKVRVPRGSVTVTVTIMIALITVNTVAVNTVAVTAVAVASAFITTGGGTISAIAIGMMMAIGAVVIGVMGVANVVGHEWSAVLAVRKGPFGLFARVEVGGAVTVTMFLGVDLHFFSFLFVVIVERLFVGRDGERQAGWRRCGWMEMSVWERRSRGGHFCSGVRRSECVRMVRLSEGGGQRVCWETTARSRGWCIARRGDIACLPGGIEIESLKINMKILVFLTAIHAKIIGAPSRGSIQM